MELSKSWKLYNEDPNLKEFSGKSLELVAKDENLRELEKIDVFWIKIVQACDYRSKARH